MQKTGYLLINLGTPEAATTPAVRAYLNEFLMDEHVISAPWLIRRLLVSLFILPFRPKNSAHAYAKIWTDEGSPLLTHTQALCEALRERLSFPIEFAMRYGQPDIAGGIERLKARGIDELVIVPLYPQFADSTVTTSIEKASNIAKDLPHRVLPPFYQASSYVNASSQIIREHLPETWDHLLLSFHGLPEQHLIKADPTGSHCLQSDNCCDQPSKAHDTCYRHQSLVTSQKIANTLGISDDQYTVSFQSRLGRLPWLRPYTDEMLSELPSKGVERLVVACPAFVADNLETLEEIAIQGRETFLSAGGKEFTVIPCLNTHSAWVEGLAQLLTEFAEIIPLQPTA